MNNGQPRATPARKQIGRGLGRDFECENPGGPLILRLQRESCCTSTLKSLGGVGRGRGYVSWGRGYVSWRERLVVFAFTGFKERTSESAKVEVVFQELQE